jgi:hypothetical protein
MSQPHVIPLRFERGVNEFFEDSDMPEGYGSIIQNWVPEASGSLRVPWAWLSASATGLTGTRTARGIAYFVPAAGARFVLAQATSGTQYKLVWIAKSALVAGTWATIETVTSSPSTRPLAMAAGAGLLLYCSPEFPTARIRKWDGTTAADASTLAIAGRTLIYHNNRFFTGGDLANPTFLRWSELGDGTVWSTETNEQPIGQDDGEPIEDLCSWDRAMFIGKENSIWVQSGFGPSTFSWRQMDGGGCAPGRTLVACPEGVMAIGRERIWWLEGGGFSPISGPIETSYGMTGNYMSGTYVDGTVHVCDEGSGKVWIWEIASQAWHTELFGTVNEGPGILSARADYLLGGAKVGSTNSLLLYRQMPGASRARIPGSAQAFRAATGYEWMQHAVGPFTARHLYFKLRQRGGSAASTPLTITHSVVGDDGEVSETVKTESLRGSAGTYRVRVDLGQTGYGHKVEFSQTVGASDAGVCDIEDPYLQGELANPR